MFKMLMILVGLFLAAPVFENVAYGETLAFSLNPSELQLIQNKTTPSQITIEQLAYWDQVIIELITKSPLKDGESTRLAAYLYNAQKAFADASYALTGSYSGSLDTISLHVLRLFYPSYEDKKSPENAQDTLSNELTKLLAKKIDARFQEEQSQIHPFPIKEGKDLWQGKQPYMGLSIPSMKPWILKSADEFRVPPPRPPADPFWEQQLAQVKQSMNQVTEYQKKQILYWAGMSPPGSGDWHTLAATYMTTNNTPLAKSLEVHAVLAATLMDAVIAIWDSKYAFMVRRPDMLDPSLKPFITTPNHPSYPAGHSGASTAAAVLLSLYFPENKIEWERMAEECGQSRIWAGIHFPIDISVGNELGAKIGQAAILKAKRS